MTDPKEVAPSDSNSSCPINREQMIDWFTRDGEICPNVLSLMEHSPSPNYPHLWNRILDLGVSSKFHRNCWLTRSGRVWGCNWAAHEFLLSLMGLKTSHVEDAGWVRISSNCGHVHNVQILVRPSFKQRRFLRDNNLLHHLDHKVFEPLAALPPATHTGKYE